MWASMALALALQFKVRLQVFWLCRGDLFLRSLAAPVRRRSSNGRRGGEPGPALRPGPGCTCCRQTRIPSWDSDRIRELCVPGAGAGYIGKEGLGPWARARILH